MSSISPIPYIRWTPPRIAKASIGSALAAAFLAVGWLALTKELKIDGMGRFATYGLIGVGAMITLVTGDYVLRIIFEKPPNNPVILVKEEDLTPEKEWWNTALGLLSPGEEGLIWGEVESYHNKLCEIYPIDPNGPPLRYCSDVLELSTKARTLKYSLVTIEKVLKTNLAHSDFQALLLDEFDKRGRLLAQYEAALWKLKEKESKYQELQKQWIKMQQIEQLVILDETLKKLHGEVNEELLQKAFGNADELADQIQVYNSLLKGA
jgi:hypothetical protein